MAFIRACLKTMVKGVKAFSIHTLINSTRFTKQVVCIHKIIHYIKINIYIDQYIRSIHIKINILRSITTNTYSIITMSHNN